MGMIRKGVFARSLAGHDKDKLYIVISFDERYVYLSDGRLKPLDKLKKKKYSHVQLNYTIDNKLAAILEGSLPLRDEDIRMAIKCKEEQ